MDAEDTPSGYADLVAVCRATVAPVLARDWQLHPLQARAHRLRLRKSFSKHPHRDYHGELTATTRPHELLPGAWKACTRCGTYTDTQHPSCFTHPIPDVPQTLPEPSGD